MNRRIWLLCMLGGSLSWGQGSPGATAVAKLAGQDADKNPPTASPATVVAMDAPVLTIKGFCPGRSRPVSAVGGGALCQTVITRAQFEEMAAAIRPNMTASVKQQLASLYPRLLVMSQRAEELGLDKQPPYKQMIEFSRMQILTQGLTRKLQQESANVSDGEIADYYRKNPEVFEQFTLERLLVPLRKQPAASKTAINNNNNNEKNREAQPARSPEAGTAEQAASEQELTELAQSLRVRAAAGEDFVKLQREAFEAAEVKVASPTTNMGKVRRTALPATHVAIFELKVGGVSPVITDAGGHYVYKLDAKDRLPIDEAKAEIRQTLESQREKEATDKIQDLYSTETNEAYFGLPARRGQ